MKHYQVPMLEGESFPTYLDRVTSMLWQFEGSGELSVSGDGIVSLKGLLPVGENFVEIQSEPDTTAQGAMWDKISLHRDKLQKAGALVGAFWIHNDVKSRTQWERMANKAEKLGLADSDPYLIDGEQVPWKTMNGTFTLLTAGYIRQVVDALEIQEARIFKVAEMHRAAMLQHADPSLYDFSTNWPAVYEPVE